MSISTVVLMGIVIVSLGISLYSLVSYVIERQTKNFRSYR